MLREHGDLLAPIAAGGALGSLARWGFATVPPHGGHTWPWATLLPNASGCLLLGVLMAFVLGPWSTVPFWSRYLRPFLGVGVLGGYTTFSTYELETYVLGGHAPAPATAMSVARSALSIVAPFRPSSIEPPPMQSVSHTDANR